MSPKLPPQDFIDYANSFLIDYISECCNRNWHDKIKLYFEHSTHREALEKAFVLGLPTAVIFKNLETVSFLLDNSVELQKKKIKQKEKYLQEEFIITVYAEKTDMAQLLLSHNSLLVHNKKINLMLKGHPFRKPSYKKTMTEQFGILKEQEKLKINFPKVATTPTPKPKASKI